MNAVDKQQVSAEIIEKLSACERIENASPVFSIGKDIISSCPNNEDLREVIDQLTEFRILDLGFGYVKGASSEHQLTFIRLNDEDRVKWIAQNINVCIETYTQNQLVGVEELCRNLAKTYATQHREVWIPAFASGLEIEIFATLGWGFAAFIKYIVLPGLAWDATKGVLSYLWKGLTKFTKANGGIELSIKFQFNDIEIIVNGLMAESYGRMSQLFVKMYEQLQFLQNHDIEKVSKIELPYQKDDETTEGFSYDMEMNDISNCWWKVTYLKGCCQCWYNPQTREIV